MPKIRVLVSVSMVATLVLLGVALSAAAQGYPDSPTGTGLPPPPPDGSCVAPPMALAATQSVGIWSAFAQSVYQNTPDFWRPASARQHPGSARRGALPVTRNAIQGRVRPRPMNRSAR